MNAKLNKKINKKIKIIKQNIILEMFDTQIDYNLDTSKDILAIEIYDNFEKELIEWLNNNYNNKDKFENYGNYLVNLYLATNLDQFNSSLKIKEIRKVISKIIDELLIKSK